MVERWRFLISFSCCEFYCITL